MSGVTRLVHEIRMSIYRRDTEGAVRKLVAVGYSQEEAKRIVESLRNLFSYVGETKNKRSSK